MATAVRISDSLLCEARKYSKVDHRSLTGQIEHWATIGKCAEENPDLTYELVKQLNKADKAILDDEIKEILGDPEIGTEKKGDLRGGVCP